MRYEDIKEGGAGGAEELNGVMANRKHGVELENLDLSVDPRQDFYNYACGGWMRNNPLKAEYARYGTFDKLREAAQEQLKNLIENMGDSEEAKTPGSNAQKIADLYALGMDSERRNREGAAPLRPLLERIESIQLTELEEFIGYIHNGLGSPFFGTAVSTDARDADYNVMHIGEVGLGLGDRDFYLEESESNKAIMEAYERYIKRMMELIGYDGEAQQRVWENLISLEREFAKHKKTREERRDPQLRYNMMTIEEIEARYPNFGWRRYFKALGVPEIEKANVTSLRYLEFLNDFLPTLSLQQVKDYLTVEAVTDASNLLSDDFEQANFDLYSRTMAGIEEMEPRWKRVMAIPNSMFGEAVGELYVKRFFPEENKRYMKEMVENLRHALGKHIEGLSWMSEATKSKALEKLDSFTVKIGYPDKWKDYSGIEINPSRSYMENVAEASRWYAADNYKKMGKRVDKDEWHMTPQTVNAYYNPTTNEICFPAAILQAPYFDLTADDAQNYGAIGVVIGHEMTHGFDDSGRQYDKAGNLNDWWQAEDTARFKALADSLAAQFDAIEVAPGVNANGRFTLGENIADQGGLRIALTAYLDALPAEQRTEIDGFTATQRFYLAYANVWANNIRPEEILLRTKTDPHSLGEQRVNATLKNIDSFHEAFAIGEGDGMFRPASERIVIW